MINKLHSNENVQPATYTHIQRNNPIHMIIDDNSNNKKATKYYEINTQWNKCRKIFNINWISFHSKAKENKKKCKNNDVFIGWVHNMFMKKKILWKSKSPSRKRERINKWNGTKKNIKYRRKRQRWATSSLFI